MPAKVIVFKGRNYVRDETNGYYRNNATRKGLHVATWEHHNGPVPKGHEVHHVDHDKNNNQIGNLECLSAGEHKIRHWLEDDGTKLRAVRANIAKATEAARAWHATEAGREWHRQHAQQHGFGKTTGVLKQCEHCGADYVDSSAGQRGRHCTKACKAAARRASGVDNTTTTCKSCGDLFTHDKNQPRDFCCRSCAQRARHRTGNSV